MGLLDRLFSVFKLTSKETTISILGPSKAGKTTLVRYLETGKQVEDDPLSTLGVDYRSEPIKTDSLTMNLIDVGGQKLYQDAFWDFAIEQSNGLIYVIDALIKPNTHPDKFNEQIQQFQYAMSIVPEDTVLMILLNKQDLQDQNPISAKDFSKIYPMNLLVNRTISILPTSAKFGEGVDHAFEWFVEAMSQKFS